VLVVVAVVGFLQARRGVVFGMSSTRRSQQALRALAVLHAFAHQRKRSTTTRTTTRTSGQETLRSGVRLGRGGKPLTRRVAGI